MKSTTSAALLLLTVVLLLSGCGGRDGSGTGGAETAPAYSFNVDPELLGEEYADRALGLRLAPPSEWSEAPAALREQIAGQIAAETGTDAASALRALFVERSSGSALVVYEPLERDDPGRVFDEWVGQAAETAEFRHNGLRFFQARVVTEREVRFTLVTEARDGAVAVIQYFMPQSRFQEIGRRIESSIGSIAPLTGDT
jgi:hypothetical protein